MATQITLSGGAFQDAQGNVLANGTLVLRLTSDAVTTDAVPEKQILGNIPITITLDASGNVSGTPKIWSNAELSPSGTGYSVLAFSAAGAPSWKTSQIWAFTQAGGSTVDLGTMVPTSTGVSYVTPIITNPSAAQVIATNNLLPANGNTTQSLGSVAAPWVAELYSLNTVLMADAFAGATADAKITAALAALPVAGGIIDARGLIGAQSFVAAITISKPVILLLPEAGAATFTFTSLHALQVQSSNVAIIGGSLQMNGINCIGVNVNKGSAINNIIISDMTITGDGASNNQVGIQAGNTVSNLTIRRNTIVSISLGAGMFIGNDLTDPCTNNLIEGNTISIVTGTASGTGYGIALNSSVPSGTRIVNNFIEKCQRHAIYMATGGGYYCAGNYIKNHGSPLASAGGPAIEHGRGSDSVITGNIIDTPLNVAIQVFSADTSSLAFADSKNIIVSNNVVFGQQSGWHGIDVTSDILPPNNIPSGIIIANNVLTQASLAASCGLINVTVGKQISIRGNYLNAAASVSGNILIDGNGETAGTSNYSDEIHISDNLIISAGGSDTGILFLAAAATSGLTATIRSNRTKSTAGVSFAGGSFTNTHVSTFDNDTSLPISNNIGVGLKNASFSRSSGNTSFPDIFGDGTNAFVIAGKSDGSGVVTFGATTAVKVPSTLTVQGATPTGSSTDLGLGVTVGFGNGAAATAVTTTLKATGSGPTTPQTVVKYLQIDIGGTKFWLPLVQ